MKRLRVILWTTGKIGKKAFRAILDDPRLELVGVFAHSAEKVGVDVGTLCDGEKCGIRATDDIDALIALQADSVVYAPLMADLDQALMLLENGMDLVSTNMFLNVGGVQGEVRAKLETACRKGNSSLYLTGVNPGWIDAMATAATAVCRKVASVTVNESADCSVYESVETWAGIGFGSHKQSSELMSTAEMWLTSFRDAVASVGEALNLNFDKIEFTCDYATAAENIDLGWFKIPKGANAALRGGWQGIVDGKVRVQANVVWYLTRNLHEKWVIDDEQYHVEIKGEPGVDMRIRCIPTEEWEDSDWDVLTALPAVSAIPDIKAARAGVLGVKDVALPRAPVGLWRRSSGAPGA